mgnify:CR=1 FL=1
MMNIRKFFSKELLLTPWSNHDKCRLYKEFFGVQYQS